MIFRFLIAFLVGLILTIPRASAQDTIPLTMDLNSDGRVDKSDLLRMALEWRTGAVAGNPKQYKPISGDLLKMLGEWHWQEPVITNPHTGLEEVVISLPNLEPGAIPLVMVHVPAGTFMMGTQSLSPEFGEEWTAHEVTLTQSFYLGKFEITQAQWKAVMGVNPATEYNPKPNSFGIGIGPNLPANFISWNDCQAFVQKLNELGLGAFRLPTEAEWEYACRAGTTTAYSHGEGSSCSNKSRCSEHDPYMWYGQLSSIKTIGTKWPNPWGLLDMHGNLYEWCQDYWQLPFSLDPRTDPQGPLTSPLNYRIIRSGSYQSLDFNCRSANRSAEDPSKRYYMINPQSYFSEFGFRLAASAVDVRR